MEINLDNITFGNPTIGQKRLIEKTTYLDYLFANFQESPFPINSSETTKVELNQIANFLTQIQNPENLAILNNYLLFDINLGQSIINIFDDKEINLTDLVSNIISDVKPLIVKLKLFYNRPRPYQLANYYKLKLFPFDSKSSFCPSYPCEHTILAKVILEVIKQKHPDYSDECVNAFSSIMYSRLYLGLNYQSDNDFAIEIADEILKSKKFTTKYDI